MLPPFGDQSEHPSKLLQQRIQLARLPTCSAPKTTIFCYQNKFLKKILETMPHQQCDGCFSKLYFLKDYPGVAIANFGTGAPVIAPKMEELIAWGVQEFISMGTAGSLQQRAKVGDIIVCEKAIRGEMTSQNYLPPTKYIHAPRRMTNKLQLQLKKANIPFLIGSTWTTDTLYQQTTDELTHYQKEGVLTIESETAALFAVAHFYQVDLSAIFTIGEFDLVPQSDAESAITEKGLNTILAIAIAASLADY